MIAILIKKMINYFCYFLLSMVYFQTKLRNWIDPLKLDSRKLSFNYNAIDYINKNKIRIVSTIFNSNAKNYIDHNIAMMNWIYISKYSDNLTLISQNLDKISWNLLSLNPNAIPILKENLDKIKWSYLSENPAAIKLLMEYPDKIEWKYF